MKPDPNHLHSDECLLLPGNPLPAVVKLARPLPCFVILVHGVNDLGEAYSAQESGICAGLNRRLHRDDLKPASYRLPPARDDPSAAAQKELHTVLWDPDAVYYKRSVDPASAWNPVIPFYWGSRVDTSKGDTTRISHGQLVDRHGNRVDRNGAKEGGPFANATNNLVDMWGDGFSGKAAGIFDMNRVGGEPTHPLFRADSRRYMILAAQRLAMVIEMIRDRNSQAVVNLVAHSQGTLISLLAQAILARKGKRRADCLILNHSCYSLEETWADEWAQAHGQLQTTHARVTTLCNLIQLVTQSPQPVPALATLLDPGRNGGFTGMGRHPGYSDRDNRGRVFLYFCPEDATVGLRSIQGIGWQGIPENLYGRLVMKDLGPRFHQRVWTMRERNGKPTKVGEGSRYVLVEKGEKFWCNNVRASFNATPTTGEPRILATGVDLPVPFKPNLRYGEAKGHDGFLDVSPSDAATAITNKGEYKTNHPATGKPQELVREDVDDRRTSFVWKYKLRQDELKELEARLNAGKGEEDRIKVRSARSIGNGKLRVEYLESDRAAQIRWQAQERDANSYHSAIVANPEHSQHVTAWDLAIGPARICKDKSKAKTYQDWVRETRDFIRYLCAVSDWRVKPKNLKKIREETPLNKFYNEDVEHNDIIENTAIYYNSGVLPEKILLEIEDLLPMVLSESLSSSAEKFNNGEISKSHQNYNG